MAFDKIITGGTVVDGTGRARFLADVGIEGDTVTAVGDLAAAEAAERIDASGRIVCPGFINIHSHEDIFIIRPDYMQVCEPCLRQGITTAVVCNCGWSPAPWSGPSGNLLRQLLLSMGVPADLEPQWETQSDFHAYLRSLPPPINLVPMAAHGSIRIAVMGEENRCCNEAELDSMKRLVKDAMEAGCRGFSTGLTYFPGVFAHTDEIVELAKVAAAYGGRYATHVRGHSETYPQAVAEAIEISDRAGLPLQLSHVFAVPYLGTLAPVFYRAVNALEAMNKVVPLPGWPNPFLKKAMRRVDEALERGADIGMDFIPYVLGNTTATQLYPPWANLGGTDALLERLREPEMRARIRRDVEKLRPTWPHWEEGSWPDNYIKSLGWSMFRILSVGSEKNLSMEGHPIPELARAAGKDPFDFLADLVVDEEGSVTFLFGMEPRPWTEKVLTCAQGHPALSVGADTVWPQVGDPPPSGYGCFPRILGHYVRELGMYTLEDGVRRCTGLSAERFNLQGRGVIEPGAFADIVIFDPGTVAETATIEEPRRYPTGIDHVLVNGEVMVERGEWRGAPSAGRVLTA